MESESDYVVIGSGFGGSVSALRLAEAGHSVEVLESGRRFEDHEFAKSSWNIRKYFFAPKLGLRGVLRLSMFRDVFIATGSGVGGGSLGYANTLWRPVNSAVFSDPQWAGLADWKQELEPHYATAETMLGVTQYHPPGEADKLIERLGKDLGVEETYTPSRVGVYLGAAGETVSDPYFGGSGPDRTGCLRCGACMVGCRYGAKNTLMKNYLWFAEKEGAHISANRTVTTIEPLNGADGAEGWRIISERSGSWFRKQRKVHIARKGVIVAAGALGSTKLMMRQKLTGSLPRLSDRVGELVRTNSESILGVTARSNTRDYSQTVAISSSIWSDDHTHIEPVTYGRGGGAIGLLSTILVGEGNRITRPLKFMGNIVRHPLRMLRVTWPRGWSKRSFLILVMQSHDNAIRFRMRRRRLLPGYKFTTEQNADKPNPTFILVANEAAERIAEYMGGDPQSNIVEALFNIPTTAHLLGGCAIGDDPSKGVVNASHQVFGYDNLYVIDGSAVPVNLGVNPSLTITALAERAVATILTR